MEYLGQQFDRGQLLAFGQGLNDEKLSRLGYVAKLPRDTVLKECGECGARFIGEGERTGHYKARHGERFLNPQEEDEAIDRQERLNNDIAPLYLDKTKASMDAGDSVIEVTTATSTKRGSKAKTGKARSATKHATV